MFKAKFESRCANEACPHPIYRLVIMDLNMPIMDGFDASTHILKMRADNPQVFPNHLTTIIALTSYTDLSTKTRCLEIGCKEVLHKPLNADELKRVLAMYHCDIPLTKYN
jgi:two-component system, sensor histidine kinase and response regulator